jgi:hypothetical protein
MNEAELEQLQDYFVNVIEQSLNNLRSDLLQQLRDMLQNASFENSDDGGFIADGAISDFGDSLGDFGVYAAISSVIPLNASAKLPNGLNSAAIFRPALRRIGTIAGRNIAAQIFDNNAGRVKYGSNQISDVIKTGLDKLFD